MDDKKILFHKYLTILGECYSTGDFEDIFPFLSDDCVWESQWRFTPETGKIAVEEYFRKKGQLIQESDSNFKYMIVEFIDNLNLVDNVELKVGGKISRSSMGILYEPGKLAIFASQQIDDIDNGIIIDIKINKDNLISRIDICNPMFFKFKKYEGEIRF